MDSAYPHCVDATGLYHKARSMSSPGNFGLNPKDKENKSATNLIVVKFNLFSKWKKEKKKKTFYGPNNKI